MHELFPDAPVYTSAYLPGKMPAYKHVDVRTTFIQKLPFFKKNHKFAFLLRMYAFSRLDLSDYDIVISSTTAEAKGVRTKRPDGTGAFHICDCNTPTRYYWSGFEEYLREPGFGPLNPLARLALRVLVKPLRTWDLKLARSPDAWIGNSTDVAERIKTYYDRQAHVLFPSVEVEQFPLHTAKRSGYVIAGRQVPYKRVDLAVEACNRLGASLTVIGRGSEHAALRKLAGPTIRFRQANDHELAEAYGHAKALLYPCVEDAGIVPVEAMSTGTPVIAYGKGGTLDSVVNGLTGIFFSEQTVTSLTSAIERFEEMHFNPESIHRHARQFSKRHFQEKLLSIISDEYRAYLDRTPKT
jgi:glycosyltransferase involved in cell wall biosynthesis